MEGFRELNSLIVLVVLLLSLSLRFQGNNNLVFGQTVGRITVPSERFALIRLRLSLGIRAKDWPIKPDPCVFWKGIQCVNGSVVGVNVSGLRRTNFGRRNPQFNVDSLVNLTSLTSFNASGFSLPGQIPDLFGQSLGKLRVLDLRSCNVTGAVPFSLGNLTRLSVLVLSQNKLSGIVPTNLGQLVGLSTLDLSRNFFIGSIPDTLASLRNLSYFDLSSNSISGPIPPGIGILSNLRSLNLSHNQLTSDIPPQLGDLRTLVDLDLSFNLLTSTLPLDLKGLRSLRTMSIGNNRLSGVLPDGLFSGLTELVVVDFSHNNFSGDVPDVLWTMSTLRLLDVSGNSFTGILPNATFDANATSAVLKLSYNKYYGGLSSVLQRFNSVDLTGNYFEGKVLDLLSARSSFDDNCLQNATNQRTVNECASFYTSKGMTFDNFGLPRTIITPTAEPVPAKKRNTRNIILAAVLGGVGVLILVILLLLLVVCVRRKSGPGQITDGGGNTPTTRDVPPTQGVSINFPSLGDESTYEEILQIAGNFSDASLIKKGHSGDLYRGVLDGGIPVVIKKVHSDALKKGSYLTELDFFCKVSHPRLVPLLGYCLEQENEKYLVYKYMPNSDLSSSLHKTINMDDDGLKSMDWITRSKVAIGTAECLSYLHHECTPPFVHRDVQANSILLDDKFEVRLGSLSEVCVQEGEAQPGVLTRFLRLPSSSEHGTSGSQTSNCAYDVYCFGKVLLELVTGKLGISASNDASVREWLDQTFPFISIYDKELVTRIVDPTLMFDEDLLEEIWAMAIVARSCLNPRPSRRPLMKYVLRALENPLRVVREENTASGRLRTTSSRGSWNASVFGSWRQSVDVGRVEGTSGHFVVGDGGLSSRRRQSREIFPEPIDEIDVERRGEN